MSVETITLGCRLNFAESEAMRGIAPQGEKWVIVNSCAVTGEAVRQTRQVIRRAHRDCEDARIVVTGCAAQLDPQAFAAMPEVDRVVGNGEKLLPAAFHLSSAPGNEAKILVSDVMTAEGPPAVAAGFLSRVRSFVAIQTGCDHRCTFCTIWKARGLSQSLAPEAILDAVAEQLDRGAREIVLTGVDITSYRHGPLGLGALCKRILASESRLKRLRLSSLDSVEIDEPLFELIAGEQRLMPHFHLSLQAGDDLVLKRMKRRHSRADAVRLVERLKAVRSNATIGADLIAGFPTETEDMAINSLKLLEDCDIIAAHVFPFSPRPGTPAERMPQVERETIKARAAGLRSAAAERRSRWLDGLIGSVQPVLIENSARGHSDGFAPVAIAGSARGECGQATIVGRDGDCLTAQWTERAR